jgi:hypothetical protein
VPPLLDFAARLTDAVAPLGPAESAEVMFRQVNKITQNLEYYVHFEECALPNPRSLAVESFRATRALSPCHPRPTERGVVGLGWCRQQAP